MALPKKKNPNAGVLKSAQSAKAAKEMADRLQDQASRMLREADQLRVEGEDAAASRIEADASDLANMAVEKNSEYQKLRKKAESNATIAAAVGAIPGAGMQYVKSYAERFINITNPVNRFQDVIAAATPFAGSFSRIKDKMTGGGFGSDDKGGFGLFGKIADKIEESNIALHSIARSQVKLISAEQMTAGRVDLVEGATRDLENKTVTVISTLGDIKDILSKGPGGGGGGASPFPDFGTPPPRPPAGPGLPAPQLLRLNGPAGQGVRFTGSNPASVSTQLQTQTNALLGKILGVETEQLKEAKEGDEDARLREARARGDTDSKMGPFSRLGGGERQGGGIMGAIGGFLQGIMRNIGGFFTRGFGIISRFLAPVAAGIAAVAGFLGLGRGGGATAMRTAGGRAAQAIARGRGPGLTLGGRAVARGAAALGIRGVAGAARFIPGIGNIVGAGMGGWEAVQQARRGNWGGAAANLGAAGVSLINPWAGIAASAGASLIDTSRPGRTETPTQAERRLQRLENRSAPTPAPRPTPPMIITNNYNTTTAPQEASTVIAQNGKTLEDRRREMFAYTA